MGARAICLLAVILTALALVPVGAHFFELPNKIHLDEEAYFTVQGIYRGWSLFGFVLIPAIGANAALAIMLRRSGRPFGLALFATVALAATLAIFFSGIFPANQATANWTVAPANWRDLRGRWEYLHAVNAIITFVALCSVTLAVLTAAGRRP